MLQINSVNHGDSAILLKEIPENYIDLTVTSPPYDDLRDYDGYTFDFKTIADELFRVTKDGGVVVWVVNDKTENGSETGTSFKQALYFKEIGFKLHDTMIYEKTGCAMPSPNRYLSSFEYMFVFSKGSPKTFNPIKDRKNRFPERWGGGRKVRNKDGSWSFREKHKGDIFGRRFNIWRYNNGGQGYGSKDEITSEHPATFPEALAQDHIISWSNEGDLILDPLAGSGTTLKMAKLNRRNFIGIEVSSKYCQIIEKRLAKYNNQSIEDFLKC